MLRVRCVGEGAEWRVVELRCWRQAGDFEDFLLGQRFACEECLHQRIERFAMLRQQALRFLVTLAYDALHLDVDQARGLVTEGLLSSEPGDTSGIRVLTRLKLDHT